jgi:phosphoenolpyruvate carboxykinase (GTP)
VESKTFICTPNKYDSVPHVREGVEGILGRWMGAEELGKELNDRFPGCMAGKNCCPL